MSLYRRFLQSEIDFSPIGLARGPRTSDYFCTPRRARVIGWAGVDGIHYCLVEGFGEIVFSVSPMNLPGEYVHPIAGSVEDFLSMILHCGSLDAMEQTHGWNQTQFDAFLREYPPTQAQQAVLDAIREEFGVEPMEDTFACIKQLQQDFDYSRIFYKPEYYETFPDAPKPAWGVTYDGGFLNRTGQTGKEIPVNKSFPWGDNIWHIPAVYACAKGLVVDFCVEVPRERVKSFFDKWYPILLETPQLPKKQQRQLNEEHPMSIPHFRTHIMVNGKALQEEGATGTAWTPDDCVPERIVDQTASAYLLDHYDLDPDKGWIFHRVRLKWATLRRPTIKKLFLRLEQMLVPIYGPTLPTPEVGEPVSFTHPITGQEHTLTITEIKHEEMKNPQSFGGFDLIPTHYTSMEYTLSPDIPKGFSLHDTVDSDSPRRSAEVRHLTNEAAAAIGIIGGADSPTSIIYARGAAPHSAHSSLHFEPAETVTWQMVFHEKMLEDTSIMLVE